MNTISKRSKVILIIVGLIVATGLFFGVFYNAKALSPAWDQIVKDIGLSSNEVLAICNIILCTDQQLDTLQSVASLEDFPTDVYTFTQFMMRGSSGTEVQKFQEFLNDLPFKFSSQTFTDLSAPVHSIGFRNSPYMVRLHHGTGHISHCHTCLDSEYFSASRFSVAKNSFQYFSLLFYRLFVFTINPSSR